MLRSMQKRIAMGEEGVGRVRLGGVWANGGGEMRRPERFGSHDHGNMLEECSVLRAHAPFCDENHKHGQASCPRLMGPLGHTSLYSYACRWSFSAGPCRERGCPLKALLGYG